MPTPKRRGDLGQGETINATGKKINTGAFGADKKAGRPADALSARPQNHYATIFTAGQILKEIPLARQQVVKARWWDEIKEADPNIISIRYSTSAPGGMMLFLDTETGRKMMSPVSDDWAEYVAGIKKSAPQFAETISGAYWREQAKLGGEFTLDDDSAALKSASKRVQALFDSGADERGSLMRRLEKLEAYATKASATGAAVATYEAMRAVDPNIESFTAEIDGGGVAFVAFSTLDENGNEITVTPFAATWGEYAKRFTQEERTILLGHSHELTAHAENVNFGRIFFNGAREIGFLENPDDYTSVTG